MSVYERIDFLRKSKGIKWNYINEKVPGTYHGRMTELKNGKTTLSRQQLEIIADILETSTDYLLGNTDDPSPAGQKEISPQIGEPPTIKDWEKALEGKSKEELKEIIEIVMKKFMESE